MDRISRCSQGVEGFRFGNFRIGSLLFADDVVLLVSSGRDLQLSLMRFAAECEVAETIVVSQKRVECPLRVGNEDEEHTYTSSDMVSTIGHQEAPP